MKSMQIIRPRWTRVVHVRVKFIKTRTFYQQGSIFKVVVVKIVIIKLILKQVVITGWTQSGLFARRNYQVADWRLWLNDSQGALLRLLAGPLVWLWK